jgi:GT2 family glycosyltransferase
LLRGKVLVSESIIYVVIANWNGKEVLEKCLFSLFANTSNPQCKVVVVDNASKDGSREMLQKDFPKVEVIKNAENAGFSRANNQGIRYALANRAKYVLLLNNDVEITDRNWLQALTCTLESDNKIGIVGCKLLYPNGKIQHAGGLINITGGHNRGEGQVDTGKYDKVAFVDFVTGAVLLIRADVIRKIGFLDEGFTPLYFEDADWCVRSRLYGFKIAYSPNPTLIHHCGSSAKKLNHQKKTLFHRRSFIRFFLLNFQFADIVKRIIKFETRIAIKCFLVRTKNRKLPFGLRPNPSTKLMLFAKAWFPSIRNLKGIIALRRQRFKRGYKIA